MLDLQRVVDTYDVLSAKVKNDLNDEFKKGRIKGTEYANVYSSLMSIILQLSMQVPEIDHKLCLIDAQRENTIRNTAKMDDDVVAKVLDSMLNSWAEAFKSGQLEYIPSIVNDDKITDIVNAMITRVDNQEWRNDNYCGLEKDNNE